MRKIALCIALAVASLTLLVWGIQKGAAQVTPQGRHCGDVGPLPGTDPTYCGCTWGQVLFNGQPVAGTAVTLTFGGDLVTHTTRLTSLDAEPYFALTAHDLGAKRGDVLTLTAQFAGQTVERVFRAWPDATDEQQIDLVFPERGVWSPWITGGYTRALALDGDVAWAGGPAGLISISLGSGISVVHTLPWADQSVRALAVGSNDHIWAAGAGGVAEFDSLTWQTHTVPLIGAARALAVDPATNAVWVGGGDSGGGVAVYAGSWQAAGTFPAPVMTLAVDEAGRVWAGTWGDGVYRQDGAGGWTRYRDTDGLASDQVLAAAAGSGAVWFGTAPYLSGSGPRGGVARYDLAAASWQVFTTAHGLPADAVFSQTPASVYALAADECGWAWAGTVDGVRYLPAGSQWLVYTTAHGLRGGPIWALAATSQTVIAAGPTGLDRLDRAAVPGNPPMAQIVTVSPLSLTMGVSLTLSGSGTDHDENGARIVAWEWTSDRDGPICSTANCLLPHALFTPGTHALALRVQDEEGVWSEAVMAQVTVVPAHRVFLPLTLKQRP